MQATAHPLSVYLLDTLIHFAGVLVAIFQHCPQLQSTLMEDMLAQVVPCLPVGKRCPRAYLVGDEHSASIQVTVGMLVQMIQVRRLSACHSLLKAYLPVFSNAALAWLAAQDSALALYPRLLCVWAVRDAACPRSG